MSRPDNSLQPNPDADRADLVERLRHAMAASQRGERCQCGRPIWIVGSAEVGLSCFACITEEAHPDKDYEMPNKCAAPNAGGRPRLAIQTSLAARVGELVRPLDTL